MNKFIGYVAIIKVTFFFCNYTIISEAEYIKKNSALPEN